MNRTNDYLVQQIQSLRIYLKPMTAWLFGSAKVVSSSVEYRAPSLLLLWADAPSDITSVVPVTSFLMLLKDDQWNQHEEKKVLALNKTKYFSSLNTIKHSRRFNRNTK